jgi:tRNA(adenine34) deaminase
MTLCSSVLSRSLILLMWVSMWSTGALSLLSSACPRVATAARRLDLAMILGKQHRCRSHKAPQQRLSSVYVRGYRLSMAATSSVPAFVGEFTDEGVDSSSRSSTTGNAGTANHQPIGGKVDSFYMKLALRHAQHAFREKEVPIGAVVVDSAGIVLATARNRVEFTKDATSHAELEAIRKAAKVRNNWRLNDCTIYTTLEPCAMCLGAIQGARIRRVVFGANDIRLGACGSWVNLTTEAVKHPFHSVHIDGGVLADESQTLLKRFFQMRRRESSGTNKSDSGGSIEQDVASSDTDGSFIVDRGAAFIN